MNLVFDGGNGLPGGKYHVLTSTNLALPLDLWLCAATNYFDGAGGFSFTNGFNANAPQQFYLLHTP
jgi:hypothetical protein